MNEYFPHDYKARHSPKLVKLVMRHGLTGIGAYWSIIEMLYENGGFINQTEYERIAFELRTDTNLIKSVIEDYDLFGIKSKKFYSQTVLNRIKKRQEKSEKARQSVTARWTKNQNSNTHNNGNTNVLQTHYESDTNKIKKKEKVNHITSPLSSPTGENTNTFTPENEKKEKNCAKKERNIIPPTLEMVASYCTTRSNNINPQTFIDHYTAKNWQIGKEKMVDWQAAVRTWEQKRQPETLTPQTTRKYGNA